METSRRDFIKWAAASVALTLYDASPLRAMEAHAKPPVAHIGGRLTIDSFIQKGYAIKCEIGEQTESTLKRIKPSVDKYARERNVEPRLLANILAMEIESRNLYTKACDWLADHAGMDYSSGIAQIKVSTGAWLISRLVKEKGMDYVSRQTGFELGDLSFLSKEKQIKDFDLSTQQKEAVKRIISIESVSVELAAVHAKYLQDTIINCQGITKESFDRHNAVPYLFTLMGYRAGIAVTDSWAPAESKRLYNECKDFLTFLATGSKLDRLFPAKPIEESYRKSKAFRDMSQRVNDAFEIYNDSGRNYGERMMTASCMLSQAASMAKERSRTSSNKDEKRDCALIAMFSLDYSIEALRLLGRSVVEDCSGKRVKLVTRISDLLHQYALITRESAINPEGEAVPLDVRNVPSVYVRPYKAVAYGGR
jgi:hypothetical protein